MSEVVAAPVSHVVARRLAEFVDRAAEMNLYCEVLDRGEPPIMVVFADTGMGKTSLLLRMVHECAQRKLRKAEVMWTDTLVFDYVAVLRKLRDDFGVDHFSAFTDLINYYTDTNYQPRLDININLQGSVQVASGAQISGSSVGDVAGVVLRDNMIVVQRPDIAVPMEVRREQLTRRFLDGLRELSRRECLVLFFDAVEKMSDVTHRWLWEQLLQPVRDGELPNVRVVLCGQRRPPEERDWTDFLVLAELKPLGVADIDAYIAKRTAGRAVISDEKREGIAQFLAATTNGRPVDVAVKVDQYLASLRPQGA